MQISFDVGIYTRLSRDDNNGNMESMSIVNQRQILTDYVKEKGWNIAEVYTDDGFSGTNFDRPDFKRMIRDIELGRINCVITKDLSRLGRNYSMTGYYTDEYFPEHQVRYIAINDGVDTMGNNNDFAAFQNVVNEIYPKQISKKVKQVKRTNAEKGLFMGSRAPYGYMKSPTNKHLLIIDEYIAPIIRRIYQEFLNGDSGRRIAEQLNTEGVLCPRAYHYQNIGSENPRKDESMLWGSATVLQLISREVYIGNMVQGQRQVVSFKSKKRRVTNPDEWIIVENTHEPIISREVWEQAQKMRKSREHIRTPSANRDISIFAGLVKCSDCGSMMAASLQGTKQKLTYRCGRYSNQGKNSCTAHNIREEVLEYVILNDIRTFAKLANEDKADLTKTILSALSNGNENENNYISKQILQSEARVREIDMAVKSLFNDKMTGKMPETFFYSLLADYEKEKKTLSERISMLSKQAKSEEIKEDSVHKWVNKIQKCLDLEHLDRPIARELIESITVSAFYKVNGKNTQDIAINYKFVGNLQSFIKGDGKIAV